MVNTVLETTLNKLRAEYGDDNVYQPGKFCWHAMRADYSVITVFGNPNYPNTEVFVVD